MSRGDWMIGLKFIRKKRGLNQQKVAMDLNISREALSYYENGKREPFEGFRHPQTALLYLISNSITIILLSNELDPFSKRSKLLHHLP